MTRKTFFLFCLIVLPAGPAAAYVIPEDNVVGEILDSIVAAEEVIDSPRVAPENVFHTGYRDLGLSYYRNAGDLLRLLPGAYTNNFGPFGNRETVRLYGSYPGQTQLLLNGAPLGCADYLGYDLHTLPVQNLKRIETAPFGAALSHDVYAPGGAVNLVSRGFSHFLPFYMFGAVMKEDLLDYTGHLHFAQRVYRNINVYISSLLKKNTDEDIDYNAVQFNVAVDFFLRDGWEGSFTSFTGNDEKISGPIISAKEPAGDMPVELGSTGNPPKTEFAHRRYRLSGRPWQNRASSFSLYTNHLRREYKTEQDRLDWSDWGLSVDQELGEPLPGHRLDARFSASGRKFIVRDDETINIIDTSRAEWTSSTWQTGISFTDRSRLLDLVDFTGKLAVTKYSGDGMIQVLPAIKLQYRDLEKADLYLTADRTYRQPGPYERSGIRFYETIYQATARPVGTATEGDIVSPEGGFNLAAGMRYQPFAAVSADAGYFLRATEDAIYRDWPDSLVAPDTLVYLGNRDEQLHGIFAHGRFSLLRDHVKGLVSYTHVISDGFTANGRLAPPPADRVAGFVEGKVTINEDKLMDLGLNVAWEVYGEMEHRPWGDEVNPWPAKPVLDITLFYNYLYIKTYLRVRNLLDRAEDTAERQEARKFFGYPRAPFNFQAGLSLELGGVYDDD